jgi:hypothetical protein
MAVLRLPISAFRARFTSSWRAAASRAASASRFFASFSAWLEPLASTRARRSFASALMSWMMLALIARCFSHF